MKISKRGIDDLIKPHEGYHAKQPDGSCKAYRCPAGKMTCGWGCTEGVTAHTHWSLGEAEEALAREMRQHEANVERLVKVPLNQGQFDALVSLCYNIGAENLRSSALLRHLNAGDYARAASHFADWKYATVRDETTARVMKVKVGTKAVMPGLVERRANEARMFLEAAPQIGMPQDVAPPRVKVSLWSQIKAAFAALGTFGVVGVSGSLDTAWIPAPPAGLKQNFVHLGQWSEAVPYAQWKMLGLGALVFAGVAVIGSLMQRSR